MRSFRSLSAVSHSFVRAPVQASARAAFLAALALAPAIVSSIGSAARSAAAPFSVQSISVAPASIWEINRPIDFVFNAPVSLASVNANTIQIERADQVPALGAFSLINPQTVRFQPVCPLLADASDAGLTPQSTYTIRLPGVLDGVPTVESTSGDPLRPGVQGLTFMTWPVGPSLFIDLVAGPPQPVIQSSPAEIDACYLEIGGEPDARTYFVPAAVPDPALGAATPPGFLAPLNLYSNPRSKLAIVLQINQSIDPSPANLGPSRLRLEYESAPSTWSAMPRATELVANCVASGSVVRVTPLGILPQNRRVRTVLGAGFQDIGGSSSVIDVVVGTFTVETAFDPGTTTPGDAGDEVLEEFDLGASAGPASLEDASVAYEAPPAVWGDDGKLTAAFAFAGSGGPGGNFDWVVSQSMILDTTFAILTNAQQTATQAVINGVVDVRDFIVLPGITLTIQGPNPARILVAGRAQIDGQILLRGANNKGVATLDTTNQQEPGALGTAGGGRGGTGNPLTTQSSPKGGSGFGAFGSAGRGGGGGESAYNPSANDNFRRPGGGGGGRLGHDALRPTFPPFVPGNPNGCPDQSVIGLDGESGFLGWPTIFQPGNIATGNNGALHPGETPLGGPAGPLPFGDGDPTNDFWGGMRTQAGALIRGELLQPWAGAGGGGGGNAIKSSSFPLNPFTIFGDEKGAGGGGGGGQLLIFALREIVFGQAGRIDAKGGTGGGGENSAGGNITRIGGGSGGGSGGHVILQSAVQIDFSQCSSASQGGIYALGGQGGAGANNLGGSPNNGVQTQPMFDALPPDAYHPVGAAPCPMTTAIGYAFNNNVFNADNPGMVVPAAGGDGGPGLIQLHVPTLADILPPTSAGENLYKCVKPPPVGASTDTVNDPATWDQLLLDFSRTSRSQSKWIALGSANVDASAPQLDPVDFSFGGTAGGVVLSGELAPILSGTLANAPANPYLAADQRTVVFDGTGLADDIYLRNPALLRRFQAKLIQGANEESFEVGSAAYDPTTGDLYITVSSSGMPLAPYAAGDQVELRPRFFRVSTDGALDLLDPASSIAIEFQAAPLGANGLPDEQIGPAQASDWTGDIGVLDVHPNAASFRFVRFRVSFDLATGGQPLTPATPVPSLEFLRVPFRF